MRDVSLERLKEIVELALECPAGERIAFLRSQCENEPQLLERAQQLLGFDRTAASFLDAAPTLVVHEELMEDSDDDDSHHPKQIGRYRIIRRIASGGAGTVYEAEQDQPQRTVALKILRADAHSPAIIRRFEREADLLAHVHHPAIAHVYEAGIHTEGALGMPFIAMELVQGARTIIAYAMEKELSIRERIELFIGVCKAVQHAHDRGIVHRDLKPANILVDASGHPKVIDFGVARIREDDDSLAMTSHTREGDIIGTLSYMAPEQCGGDATMVDARADVYALGVVLFELLAGRLPLVLAGLPFDQAIHRIRTHLPERLNRVRPSLDSDLDVITANSLRKLPANRYQSAAALAADLRRYLDHEPLVARRPSAIYQSRLFVRRHRVIVTAASIVFIALVAATLTSLSFAVHAHQSARREAESRRRAELVNEHLQTMLTLPDPHRRGEDVRVVEMLDGMVRHLDADPGEFPDVEASVRTMIGGTYLSLRRNDAAIEQLTRALGLWERVEPDGVEVADVLNQLGLALRYQGRFEEAEQAMRRTIAIRRTLPRNQAESLSIDLGNLAGMLIEMQKWDEAEPIVKEVLRLRQMEEGEFSIAAAASWRQLARVQTGRGAWVDAEQSLRQALDASSRAVDESHPIIAATMCEIGAALQRQGRIEEARKMMAQAWPLVKRTRPSRSPDWLFTLREYVEILTDAGDGNAAEDLLNEAIRQLTTELGADDLRTREARQMRDALTGSRSGASEATSIPPQHPGSTHESTDGH